CPPSPVKSAHSKQPARLSWSNMSDDPEKLKAALEQLEAERERRIEAKVAEDKAIREPLVVVSGDDKGIDAKVESARAARLAELRGAGEKREVVFDRLTIITGVPRSSGVYEPQPHAEDQKPSADFSEHRRMTGQPRVSIGSAAMMKKLFDRFIGQ